MSSQISKQLRFELRATEGLICSVDTINKCGGGRNSHPSEHNDVLCLLLEGDVYMLLAGGVRVHSLHGGIDDVVLMANQSYLSPEPGISAFLKDTTKCTSVRVRAVPLPVLHLLRGSVHWQLLSSDDCRAEQDGVFEERRL